MHTFPYHINNIDQAAKFVLTNLITTKAEKNLGNLSLPTNRDVGEAGGVVVFIAPMGAGKTTLIKAICQQLGVTDATSSPTFSIINEYATTNGIAVYHIDLYRVEEEEELYQIGLEEILLSNAYCFIEWPQKAMHLLPAHFITVQINMVNALERKIVITRN